MLEDTKRELEKQIAKGNKQRHLHLLGADQVELNSEYIGFELIAKISIANSRTTIFGN